MGKCPSCTRTINEHSLKEAWRCLDTIAAAELAARAAAEAVAALMELERIGRPFPSYQR